MSAACAADELIVCFARRPQKLHHLKAYQNFITLYRLTIIIRSVFWALSGLLFFFNLDTVEKKCEDLGAFWRELVRTSQWSPNTASTVILSFNSLRECVAVTQSGLGPWHWRGPSLIDREGSRTSWILGHEHCKGYMTTKGFVSDIFSSFLKVLTVTKPYRLGILWIW